MSPNGALCLLLQTHRSVHLHGTKINRALVARFANNHHHAFGFSMAGFDPRSPPLANGAISSPPGAKAPLIGQITDRNFHLSLGLSPLNSRFYVKRLICLFFALLFLRAKCNQQIINPSTHRRVPKRFSQTGLIVRYAAAIFITVYYFGRYQEPTMVPG